MPIIAVIILITGAFFAGSFFDVQLKQQPAPTPAIINTNIDNANKEDTGITSNLKDNYNPDLIIECQNPNCGPINIKRSLCSDTVGYVCCQIGNKWTWYASRDKCKQDQTTNINTNIQPSKQSLQPTLDQINYGSCKIQAQTKLNSCSNGCSNTNSYNRTACSFAFGTGSENGYNDSKFAECLTEVSEEYGQCQDECSNTFSNDLKVCSP